VFQTFHLYRLRVFCGARANTNVLFECGGIRPALLHLEYEKEKVYGGRQFLPAKSWVSLPYNVMTLDNWGGIMMFSGCSNNCIFCGVPKKSSSEIRKQEIGIYKDLISYKKKGHRNIELSGGDPIEYSKIIPLVKYIIRLGFKNILLNTHGKQLSDKSLTKALIHAGVNGFRIPIYGSTPKIHDSVTRAKGSFSETIKGIRNIKSIDNSIRLLLHTLVLQQNKEDIFNIFKLALKLKTDSFGVNVACIANKDYSYYVACKDLRHYLKKAVEYIFENKIQKVQFYDIPHCVFGFYNKFVQMSEPPDLGKHNQPKGEIKSDIPNLPTYRLKTKTKICKSCKLGNKCSGFFTNDIKRHGTGNLKPII